MRPFLGPIVAPDPLQPGERWRIEALVTAYGSEEVQRLLDRWGECAERIENADIVIRMADEARDPRPELDQEASASAMRSKTTGRRCGTPPTRSTARYSLARSRGREAVDDHAHAARDRAAISRVRPVVINDVHGIRGNRHTDGRRGDPPDLLPVPGEGDRRGCPAG